MRLDDPRATLLNQPKKGKLGPGIIGVLCMEATRSQEFWYSLINLASALPPGIARFIARQGSDVATLRNEICVELLESDLDWLWFIDDDHTFDSTILAKLASRHVEIVTPLCLRRVSPFHAVPTSLEGNFLRLADYGPDDLIEVQFAGASGMFVRRQVLEAIEPPWFVPAVGVSEDVGFCRKASEAGVKIHVDMGARLGHAASTVINPSWSEETGWLTEFLIGNAKVSIGRVEPEPLGEPG